LPVTKKNNEFINANENGNEQMKITVMLTKKINNENKNDNEKK